MELSDQTEFMYVRHGWSRNDVQHLADNAFEVIEDDRWAIGFIQDDEGMVWMFPVSRVNDFPLSLWKEVKKAIAKYPALTIPMQKNMDKLLVGASRYNGYLHDNMFTFIQEKK